VDIQILAVPYNSGTTLPAMVVLFRQRFD